MRNVTKTISTLHSVECFDIFVRNLSDYYRTESKSKLHKLARDRRLVVGAYFLFDKTPQGYPFWDEIRSNVFKGVMSAVIIRNSNPIIKKFNNIQQALHG